MTEKINLLNLSEPELQGFIASQGQALYRVTQLLQWIHQRGLTDFSLMTDFSKSFRQQLSEASFVRVPELALERVSADGTHKWLFRLADNNKIETVFIPDCKRGTLCVSSQVGCALNCSFCATGKEGFNRNLTLAEIVGQVWLAARLLKSPYKITNVVMMGMGEPLLNYEAVVAAMHLMMHDHAYGLSKYRVTLSTSGIMPAMRRLRKESPVSLAVSLHAPNDALRNVLVPLNKKYSLDQLIPLCRDYYSRDSKRCVTFEYVMIEGMNDRLIDAEQLIRLLADVPCKINLIPFNSFQGTAYRCSTELAISVFQKYLIDAGFNTRVRRTRGDDIAGACGQLAGQFHDRTGRQRRWLQKQDLDFNRPIPAINH
ncbi:23S rRNA (adenine(2503)-C(2))-methyltransferase RlmN [Coxiella endosymbiont of Ornithodoros maritimus]|uniref:23S rRNA (adenine(2503)-C(2))-methyltransferase RlmN n=1 Tax=Coxiella endosymbiont of Ornithodoros maritimus TaxID=1656172 RepID=UPI00226481C6|nr:23S rRNA (adenine(2503)-C(2))-methyltransferase RlmN [Coxiella endosymbiont of Ornithodoros maritimus]